MSSPQERVPVDVVNKAQPRVKVTSLKAIMHDCMLATTMRHCRHTQTMHLVQTRLNFLAVSVHWADCGQQRLNPHGHLLCG